MRFVEEKSVMSKAISEIIVKCQVVVVDAKELEDLSQFNWRLLKGPTHNTFYASRRTKDNTSELMHRRIMKAKIGDGKIVDHINKNGLDNRKENLRFTSKSRNAVNSSKVLLNKTGFRGVSKNRGGCKFSAKLKLQGRGILLGSFDTAEDAARAYDKKVIEIWGADATLNFPNEAKCPDCSGKLHRPGQSEETSCGESEVIYPKSDIKELFRKRKGQD